MVDTDAPLGFVINPPSGRNRFFVLTDRCGFIMGRSRKLDEIIVVLVRLLGSFMPAGQGVQRYRMRVLVDQAGSAYLCQPPVLFSEPPIERVLHSRGFAVVDRLVVDLEPGSLRVDEAVTPSLTADGVGVLGHLSPSEIAGQSPVGILVPTESESVAPSLASVVAGVADCAVGGSRHQILQVASQIAQLPHQATLVTGGGIKQTLDRISSGR